MDNVWMTRKASWYEMTGAFCGSLVIHALLFVLMASTSIYYPATGDIAQFDILWITPSTLPTEKLALAATPEVVTAADVTPEPTDAKPDIVEPPQIPLVEKNTEPSMQAPLEQNDEDPPVEMIAARATHPKLPPPPVKPPLKPKKTAIIIPKAQPEQEKTTETVAPPASAQAAKLEPVTKPEPPSPPPPPQPPLPPEKAIASIAEEQRMADISVRKEQQARENAEQQRLAAERKEHELRAAEAVREKAEQKRKVAEAAKEKADRERQAAEAIRLKAEQERLAAERVRQEKRAHEREQAAAEAARNKAEQQRLAQLKAEREQRAAARLQQEKLARQRAEHARIAAEKLEQERLAAAEDRQRSEQERLSSERVRLAKLAHEREQAAAENAARERQAAERSLQDKRARELERLAAERAVRERQAAEALRRSAEQQRSAKEKSEQVRLAALARPQAELRAPEAARNEPPKPRPAEKPPEARGIVLPSIHGDLKVIIAGSNDIKLIVMFREYPKSRRNRGLTRGETRREQKVTPIIVKTKEKTHEAVIEKAREGIYIFTAEADGAPSATATFTMKSFEQSQRAKTQSIGAKTIAGKAIVARVLMPDAILWEDESAFTGSMQDSAGVTKFNSETGLIWKEYSD